MVLIIQYWASALRKSAKLFLHFYILVYSHQTCTSSLYVNARFPANRTDGRGDDVKSLWPVQVGLHICYNEDIKDKVCVLHLPQKKCLLSTDRFLQFEKREGGIASNRKSDKLR
jgi:hypothetical protein